MCLLDIFCWTFELTISDLVIFHVLWTRYLKHLIYKLFTYKFIIITKYNWRPIEDKTVEQNLTTFKKIILYSEEDPLNYFKNELKFCKWAPEKQKIKFADFVQFNDTSVKLVKTLNWSFWCSVGCFNSFNFWSNNITWRWEKTVVNPLGM